MVERYKVDQREGRKDRKVKKNRFCLKMSQETHHCVW